MSNTGVEFQKRNEKNKKQNLENTMAWWSDDDSRAVDSYTEEEVRDGFA